MLYRQVANTLERSAELAEQHAGRQQRNGRRRSADIELERAKQVREAAQRARLGAEHVIRVPMPPATTTSISPAIVTAPGLVLFPVSLRAFVAHVTAIAPDGEKVDPEPTWPSFEDLGFLQDHPAILVGLSVLSRTISSWEYPYLPAQ